MMCSIFLDKIGVIEERVSPNLGASKAVTVMIESNAMEISNQTKLPVLIICYLRPRNLELLLYNLELSEREVYIFIDLCETQEKEINEEVYQLAMTFSKKRPAHVYRSSKNLGVSSAVPTAIDWISSEKEMFIILEDDCMPREGALEWFDEKSKLLDDSNVLLSGFAPAGLSQSGFGVDLIECKYPMIWGWVTTRKAWQILRPKKYSLIKLLKLYLGMGLNSNNRLSKAFFIAAQIRVQRGKLSAWDSPLALNMLAENLKALVPTSCLIENIGNDSVASHKQINYLEMTTMSENCPVSSSLEMERRIEKEIYSLKKRQILSPLKALFNL